MLTYGEQVLEHVLFLRKKGFYTQKLKIGVLVSYQKGTRKYRSRVNKIGNDRVSLVTTVWMEGKDEPELFKTYGLPSIEEETPFFIKPDLEDMRRRLLRYRGRFSNHVLISRKSLITR